MTFDSDILTSKIMLTHPDKMVFITCHKHNPLF